MTTHCGAWTRCPSPTHSEKSLGWCGMQRRRRERGVKQCEDEGLSVCFKEPRLSVLERFWLIWQNKGSREISPLLTQRLSLADSGRTLWLNTGASVNHVRDAIILYIKTESEVRCSAARRVIVFALFFFFLPLLRYRRQDNSDADRRNGSLSKPIPSLQINSRLFSLRSPTEVWALNEALSIRGSPRGTAASRR